MKNAGDSPTKRNVTSAWNCASLSRKPALNSVTSQSSLPAVIGQKMVNQAVGGASNSEHLYKPGCGAIDWYISSVPVRAVQDWCDAKWPFSLGYGATKGFIHLGIRAGRPRVRWDY
jgi:hypothetical protein